MSILLWPEGAPLASGDTMEDCPRLTPYLVEMKETGLSVPAIVICPGGGYAMRAEHEGKPIALWLNSIGISAFVLDYRVAPYKHPAPLWDAQRAIRYVRSRAEEWKLDRSRIGILGFSAGGHLASTAGTHYDNGNPAAADKIDQMSSRPDLMVLCYPVISLVTYAHQGSATNLLGADATGEMRQLLSSEMQVTEGTPPTFLWHTSDDAGVPVENSLLFASALSRHHIPFELHSFQSGEHGLGLAEKHPEAYVWPRLCELWLRRQGF